MRISRIDINFEELPERVVAELSADELLFIGRILGRQSHTDANELFGPDGGRLSSSLYRPIAELFNRFYDDGIDEALRGRP